MIADGIGSLLAAKDLKSNEGAATDICRLTISTWG